MEQKRVSIYHTCTPQHIKELVPMLKGFLGQNQPQAEISISSEGFIRYTNPSFWAFPPNQNTPHSASEAKEAAEFWLEKARSYEANAKNLYKNSPLKAEGALPLFFHRNWIFFKAVPEYSDKNLLSHWKVIYSLKLTSIEGLPKGEARVVPDHQLVLYIKYKNPLLLPAIDYLSRPIFKAEAVQSLLHFTPDDVPNLRMIANEANYTISPYKMADDGNWVAMTEVGAVKVDGGNNNNSRLYATCPKNFEDYMVFVDEEFRKMNFFLNIYYNTNNEKIEKRITTGIITEHPLDLTIIWNDDKYKKGVKVKQMKLPDFKEPPHENTALFNALNHSKTDTYWTLNFKVNLIPYDGPPFNEAYIDDDYFGKDYEKIGQEPNPERVIVDAIRQKYISNFVLSYREFPPDTTNYYFHSIGLTSFSFNELSTGFSHEIGHVWGLGEAHELNHVKNGIWKNKMNRLFKNDEYHFYPSYLMTWDNGERDIQDFELECMLIFMLEKIQEFRLVNAESKWNSLWGITHAYKGTYSAYPLDFLEDTNENTKTLRQRINDNVPRRY